MCHACVINSFGFKALIYLVERTPTLLSQHLISPLSFRQLTLRCHSGLDPRPTEHMQLSETCLYSHENTWISDYAGMTVRDTINPPGVALWV